MQMGLLMLGDASVQTMVERARLADAVGYGTVWLADERFYREVYACLSTPERNCIGGRRKNTSRAEVEVGPSQVCGTQTQLSSSIGEPAFPSRGTLTASRAYIRRWRCLLCLRR